jgi:hypothetical protein
MNFLVVIWATPNYYYSNSDLRPARYARDVKSDDDTSGGDGKREKRSGGGGDHAMERG